MGGRKTRTRWAEGSVRRGVGDGTGAGALALTLGVAAAVADVGRRLAEARGVGPTCDDALGSRTCVSHRDQSLHFITVDRLVLEQCPRHEIEPVPVRDQHLAAPIL